jgi:EAL domain-containing protein (putative c-di-GMP-specific phosphodiesterase class I)
MDVVAEGIETQSQRLILKELGCEYGQGYLFSEPLESHQISEKLLKGEWY